MGKDIAETVQVAIELGSRETMSVFLNEDKV